MTNEEKQQPSTAPVFATIAERRAFEAGQRYQQRQTEQYLGRFVKKIENAVVLARSFLGDVSSDSKLPKVLRKRAESILEELKG